MSYRNPVQPENSRSSTAKGFLQNLFQQKINEGVDIKTAILQNCYNKTTLKTNNKIPREYQPVRGWLYSADLKGPTQFTNFYNQWYNRMFPPQQSEEELEYDPSEIPDYAPPTENPSENIQNQLSDVVAPEPKQEFEVAQIVQPKLSNNNNNFSSNQMAQNPLELIDSFFDEKIRKAGQPGIKSVNKFEPDENAIYGQYSPYRINDDFSEVFDAPENAWAKNIRDRPRDFKYNKQMMDPKYAAWQAAKTGNIAYVGDFNKDKTEDVIYATPGGKIIYYNGIKQVPSNQRIVSKYHEANPPIGRTQKGAPIYDKNRPSLSQFYKTNSDNLEVDENGNIKANATIGSGLKKWSYRDLTISELVKKYLVPEYYDQLIAAVIRGYKSTLGGASQNGNAQIANFAPTLGEIKAAKNACKINTFRSIISKAIIPIMIGQTNLTQQQFINGINQIVKDVNKNLNKKVKKNEEFNPYLGLKDLMAKYIISSLETTGPYIIKQVLYGTTPDNDYISAAVYEQCKGVNDQNLQAIRSMYAKIVQGNTNYKQAYEQAHPRKQKVYKTRVMPSTANRRFNQAEVEDVMEIEE